MMRINQQQVDVPRIGFIETKTKLIGFIERVLKDFQVTNLLHYLHNFSMIEFVFKALHQERKR